MMRDLREKTKIVMLIVALAFVGLMVFEWGMDISGSSIASQTGELGRVNGEPVPYERYSVAYQELYDQARANAGGEQLSRAEIRQIEDAAFEQVVNDILMQQEIRRLGIRTTDREVIQAAQWMPHPELMQNELFQTDGQFDISKYQQFLAGPSANEQLLMSLEAYYRSTIPRSKLLRQVTSGLYLSDAELWRMWKDRNETATVEYIPLDISVLVPGEVEVTDAEVRRYYDDHEDDFERPASARVRLAFIPKGEAVADTAGALQEAQQLRSQLVGGADFAQLARENSDDPGSAAQGGLLGTFGRGQMVAPFEEAAFSLPIGEISEPVQTQFGYHLIEVMEREDDQVTARHILIGYEPSETALDALYARADSLEDLADRAGFDRAARTMNAVVREGLLLSLDEAFVPGVGSAVEAVEWARDEQVMEEPLTLSPVFETPSAFYLVDLEEYMEPGLLPFDEAAPEIRRQLIVDKKREQAREIGQEMVAEVRSGSKSLQQVAVEHGLQVQTAGPFSRVAANPQFGQANPVIGAAFGLPIGTVSDVVESSAGLFILRPTARTEASRAEFDTQKDSLRRFAMLEYQQQVLADWIEELRENADIIDRRDDPQQPLSAQAPVSGFPM